LRWGRVWHFTERLCGLVFEVRQGGCGWGEVRWEGARKVGQGKEARE